MSISREQIASLFAGWKKIFARKMNDNDWQGDTVQVWYIALNDMGMTLDQFNLAKRKSLTLKWPCTAPADFVELAHSELVNRSPDMRQAYIEAAHGRYPHAAIYETANRVGMWELRNHAESVTWPMWKQVYPKVCQEMINGATFTMPVSQQIAVKPSAPPTPEEQAARKAIAEEYYEKIKAILAGKAVSA